MDIYKYLDFIKAKEPLIYCMTNFVTVADMAQSITSIGARPLMANSYKESADIAKFSNCLLINIGTLDDNQKEGIISAYKSALANNVPIVLDPVGVHATDYRKNFIKELLDLGSPTLIKGNISEIKSLLNLSTNFKGIDSLEKENSLIDDLILTIKRYSSEKETIVVVTGKEDLVVFKDKAFCIKNGCSLMGKVTGTGCFLGAILGVFIASVGKDNIEKFYSAINAVIFWGVCGEKAKSELENEKSIFTYKYKMLDNISILNTEDLKERGRVYEKL